MAAYAAVVSLMNTIDNIHNHPRLSTCLDENQIESLGEKLDFLLDFVESYNSGGGINKEEVEDLECQIASAAHASEDVIESHVVGQIPAGSTPDDGETNSGFKHDLQKQIQAVKKNFMKVKEKIRSKVDKSRRHKVVLAGSTEESPSFLLDLRKIIEEMDSIKEKVIEVQKGRGLEDQRPKSAMPAASSRPLTTGMTSVVGFDGYLVQLLDWLTGQQFDRQIIPITGMGGIGKTTLARKVYENSLIVQHFDVRSWVTISQEYNVKKIISEILSCLGGSPSGIETEDQLGVQLHKTLSGRRYLIILDDMWSIDAWDKIKFFCPDNHNRSRIIVTTRISNMTNHFGSLGLAVNLLDDERSWDLFCEKTFAQEGCPPELEKIGRNIVKKCKGLPLSIVVIAGLLKKSTKMREYWENVAKDISSTLNSAEDNHCLNILFLSYSHLPACLKPCFLYLGIFPEDYEIHVSNLIKLWLAEGFIKPNKDQSLEEVAKGHVKDLIDRNLILVGKFGNRGKFKTCNTHDLLRDLCIKVAEKEKFFHVMKELDAPRDIDRERRIVIHGIISKEQYRNRVFHPLKSTSLARSVFFHSRDQFPSKPRLLRVLHNFSVASRSSLQQVSLRIFWLDPFPIDRSDRIYTYKLPSSISLIWNLQTLYSLVGPVKVVAPPEIWEMPQLRHIVCWPIYLPDPPPIDHERDVIVLRNLRKLGTLLNFRFSEEACKRMPNIKKLDIEYGDFSGEGETSLSNFCLYNVGLFNKLESLRCKFRQVPNRDDLLQNLSFPSSLKKLFLQNCGLDWNDMRIIGSLPHLEFLNLYINAVRGPKWNPVEGDFICLKHLYITGSCPGLIYWDADKSHFPVLEVLGLQEMWRLEEIPSAIGEILTLERIGVRDCSMSTAISAMRILEEQESLGNQGLQVQVVYVSETKREEFMEIVEQEGFTNLNFQLGSL